MCDRKSKIFTCYVPQLQPDRVLIQVEHFEGEVHSDGGSVVSGEVLVHVALDNARLPDAEVSDHQDLIAVLPLLHGERLNETKPLQLCLKFSGSQDLGIRDQGSLARSPKILPKSTSCGPYVVHIAEKRSKCVRSAINKYWHPK